MGMVPSIKLPALAAAVVALTVPAAAHAATWTVSPGESCSASGDTSCGKLSELQGKVAHGDSIDVAPGVYEDSASFAQNGLTISSSGAQLVNSKTTPPLCGSPAAGRGRASAVS
jgi:hypothetical protein